MQKVEEFYRRTAEDLARKINLLKEDIPDIRGLKEKLEEGLSPNELSDICNRFVKLLDAGAKEDLVIYTHLCSLRSPEKMSSEDYQKFQALKPRLEEYLKRFVLKYCDWPEKTFEKLLEKIASLNALYESYKALMDVNDDALRRNNSNERVLYEIWCSKDDRLKNAVVRRKLAGMTEDTFTEAYFRALFGISSEEQKPPSALVKVEENLDIIPTSIDEATIAVSGHSEKWLVKQCKEYKLTRGALNDLIYLAQEYESGLPHLLKLLDHELTIDEVEVMLNLREELSDVIVKEGWRAGGKSYMNVYSDRPSLKQLSRFYKRFSAEPISMVELCDMARQAHEAFQHKYLDGSLSWAIKLADRIGADYLETVLEYVEKNPNIEEEFWDETDEEARKQQPLFRS